MYNRKITMIVISVITIILLAVFFVYGIILRNRFFMLLLIPFIIYSIYTFRILIKEYKTYKSDKSEGLRSGILEFRKIPIKGKERKNNSLTPDLAIGVFKVCKLEGVDNHGILGKWIVLNGNFKNLKLEKHKRYKASFYINSRQLVSIERG